MSNGKLPVKPRKCIKRQTYHDQNSRFAKNTWKYHKRISRVNTILTKMGNRTSSFSLSVYTNTRQQCYLLLHAELEALLNRSMFNKKYKKCLYANCI